jgi:ASC-1-like (ASCH) protein
VIHVAVLMKPYMDMVLAGTKSVECRLTRDARDPYERIEPGERIYFKQSAGPFRATAVAEHVLFEADLTPSRIAQLKRDYNELIRGDEDFWQRKRDARFASLIWLGRIEATAAGPAVRPLQGVAWVCLDDEPAWRRMDESTPRAGTGSRGTTAVKNGSFAVRITAGNLRNNTLYLTECAERFPDWAMGGPTRSEAGRPLTLVLHDGPTVETDIVGPRRMLRTRVWGRWFRQHGARAGDLVVFTPADASTYLVGLARDGHHAGRGRRR